MSTAGTPEVDAVGSDDGDDVGRELGWNVGLNVSGTETVGTEVGGDVHTGILPKFLPPAVDKHDE